MPHRDFLVSVQLIKPAGFDGRDQFGEVVVELVEDSLHHRALVAFSCCEVPELHASMILESVFDDKPFSQQNKENQDRKLHPTTQLNPPNPSITHSPSLLPAMLEATISKPGARDQKTSA